MDTIATETCGLSRRRSAHSSLLSGPKKKLRSTCPGDQASENQMLSCDPSQPYDLIIKKCHMHLSVRTDVRKGRKAGL